MIEDRRPPVKSVKFSKFSDLIYYNLESSGAIVADDNLVDVFTDGNDNR